MSVELGRGNDAEAVQPSLESKEEILVLRL